MDQDTLPKTYTDIVNRVSALRDDGPQSIAHLIVVCYWLYGYLIQVGSGSVITHATGNVLAGYLQTIEKILQRVTRLNPERVPVSSDQEFAKPHLPLPSTNSVASITAKAWVNEVIQEIKTAKHDYERRKKSREKVEDLWRRGVSKADLEPVIQLVVELHTKLEEWSAWSARFDMIRGVEALMKIGEWEKGLSIFDLLSIEERADIAKILIRTGRLDLAERLLSEVELEISPMPPTRTPWNLYVHVYKVARAWAYLGREAKAKEIAASIPEAARNSWSEDWLSNVLAIGLYYQTQDPSRLMTQFFQLSKEIESPKERLSHFIPLLQVLLETGARQEIEVALDIIRVTLLDPRWDFKYRLGLEGLFEMLWSYRSSYSDLIYQFVAQLLIDEAQLGMTFRVEPGDGIVTIDCLRWFVEHWAGASQVRQAIKMAGDWRKELRGI